VEGDEIQENLIIGSLDMSVGGSLNIIVKGVTKQKLNWGGGGGGNGLVFFNKRRIPKEVPATNQQPIIQVSSASSRVHTMKRGHFVVAWQHQV
jgi:hypothetical protein